MRFILSVFSAVTAMIIMSAFSSVTSNMTDEEILKTTKHLEELERLNYEPKYIAPVQAALCAPANASKSGVDPHAGRYINVYVNGAGFSEMTTKKAPHFPEGTVIVKEKIKADSAKGYNVPELFTVMIKREAGYNTACGDWEFATVEVKTSKIERGKTAACMNCHTKYTATDFIKRDYLKLKYTKTLK